MPVLRVYTNVPSDKIAKEFETEMSKLVAKLLGKPESYVMIALHAGARMSVAGDTAAPACKAHLSSIGGVGPKVNDGHCAKISEALNKLLGVDVERMYVSFEDLPAHAIGKGGHTFG